MVILYLFIQFFILYNKKAVFKSFILLYDYKISFFYIQQIFFNMKREYFILDNFNIYLI